MMILFEQIHDFHLAKTLGCGQSFRWTEQPDGSFAGVAGGKCVIVRQTGDSLLIEGGMPGWRSNIFFITAGCIQKYFKKAEICLKQT